MISTSLTRTITECGGLFGRLFGHRFKGRYDNEEGAHPDSSSVIDSILAAYNKDDSLPAVLDSIGPLLMKSRIVYVHDVCTRCGQVVSRLHETSFKTPL